MCDVRHVKLKFKFVKKPAMKPTINVSIFGLNIHEILGAIMNHSGVKSSIKIGP